MWRGFAADSSTSADEEAEVDEEVDEEETGGEEPYDSGEEGEHTSVEDGFTYGESDTYDDEVYAPGSLHELNPEEAGSMFYHFSGVEQEQHLPEGCKGFDKEFELSNSRLLMARRCFFRLLERVAPTVDGVPIPGDDTLLEGARSHSPRSLKQACSKPAPRLCITYRGPVTTTDGVTHECMDRAQGPRAWGRRCSWRSWCTGRVRRGGS